MDRITIPKIQAILGRVFNKLSPNPITRTVAGELEKLSFSNIDDLNRHMQELTNKQNAAPDPEMGGLSPDQVARLLYTNWDDDNCPVKFNQRLPMDDFKNSPFFHNARLLLNTLAHLKNERTGTTKGNLTRNVVKAVFDQLHIPDPEKKSILSYFKVLNETDVKDLHHVRVVCETAGIITCQKKQFCIEKDSIELVEDKNAGKLFYRLFFGYFRKFNIAYVDGMPEFDSIQTTLPYAFYQLSKIGKKPVEIKELKNQVFLPAVLRELKDEYRSSNDLMDEVTWLVESRIVKPLQSFGLLEFTYKEVFRNFWKIDMVQKTKLFDQFMTFQL